ncbi:MAG: 2,3-bisphosphoglycerate-independent phosphoglycerate mutase [Pseudomonadota bacterium]
MAPKPTILMILDGWGISPDTEGNAVVQSGTPFLNHLRETYPHTRLLCSGEDVGLPAGIMGNSEVGHLNIGAGRIVYQDLLRIDRAIDDGSFFENAQLSRLMDRLKDTGGTLHFMGLVSDGGVHSQLTHLLALLDMARKKGVARTVVHAITDGRDTAPHSGAGFVQQVQDHMAASGYGAIATVCGRYYAMDRDQRWDRTLKAYDLYTAGKGSPESDPVAAVQAAYDRGETDEFITPIAVGGSRPIADGDGVIFFNFRADRARQITRALTDPAFSGFARDVRPVLAGYTTMTLYDESFDLPMAFAPAHLTDILGEVVSRQGLKQLRIAETEKYAHVTYFFNGGEETPFAGEDRCLIPSPRDIPTYDYKPAMSAEAVTEELLRRIDTDRYDFIVLNFANMDMVGHTGIMAAAVAACSVVDGCVGRIVTRVQAAGGVAMITADHGNSEQMIAADGGAFTQHTTNPVPFFLVDAGRKQARLREGRLADIAPTVLEVMGIAQPAAMTGESLILR